MHVCKVIAVKTLCQYPCCETVVQTMHIIKHSFCMIRFMHGAADSWNMERILCWMGFPEIPSYWRKLLIRSIFYSPPGSANFLGTCQWSLSIINLIKAPFSHYWWKYFGISEGKKSERSTLPVTECPFCCSSSEGAKTQKRNKLSDQMDPDVSSLNDKLQAM